MTALRLLMLVPVGAAAIGLVASAQTAALPILIKGIAYQSYRSGAFGDRTQEPVLDAMKSSGANYVMMSTFFFWDDATKDRQPERLDRFLGAADRDFSRATTRAQSRALYRVRPDVRQ